VFFCFSFSLSYRLGSLRGGAADIKAHPQNGNCVAIQLYIQADHTYTATTNNNNNNIPFVVLF